MSVHLAQNVLLKNIVLELVARSQMLSQADDLDVFVSPFIPRLQQACQSADAAQQLLTESEVCDLFPFLNVRKLRNMRFRNQGPAYLKMGTHRNSRVYYKRSAIESWIARQEENTPATEYAEVVS